MIYYYIDSIEAFTNNINRSIVRINGDEATVFPYEESNPYYQEVFDWINSGNILEEYIDGVNNG